MAKITGASNTQKMVMLALSEGWRLRFIGRHQWCLFQVGRQRPFANVRSKTVQTMTDSGWLTEGVARQELDFRPEKVLTADGRRYAQKLITQRWAEDYEWDPYRVWGTPDLSATGVQEAMAV